MSECEFCGKILASRQNLKVHQSKTKLCLEKQTQFSNRILTDFCKYCNKGFEKHTTKNDHESICIAKNICEKFISEKDSIIKSYESIINTLKLEHEKEKEVLLKNSDTHINDIKLSCEREKAEIYERLFNKDQEHILNQNNKLAEKTGNVTNTTIKGKNITMNSLNLSSERIESIKHTYNMEHYEAGGRGQAEWVIPHLLTDENGNIIYRCSDLSRKNFFYRDDKGNLVTDPHAAILKAAILPMMLGRMKMFRKEKCSSLSGIDDEDECNSMMEKFTALYKENKGLGVEFDKRLVELTYQK